MAREEDPSGHVASVDAWLAHAEALPPERLIRAFELAFAAMWRRAHRTLGDITLAAIVDRVLHVAAERDQAFSALALEPVGVRCDALAERKLDREALVGGIRFVLIEFLTVLGNLTADILTPALHEELARATADDGAAS